MVSPRPVAARVWSRGSVNPPGVDARMMAFSCSPKDANLSLERESCGTSTPGVGRGLLTGSCAGASNREAIRSSRSCTAMILSNSSILSSISFFRVTCSGERSLFSCTAVALMSPAAFFNALISSRYCDTVFMLVVLLSFL